MIDVLRFMEFFEKECGVRFVDAETGKAALDILAEKKNCTTCRWAKKGDGKIMYSEDMVCVNSDSEHVTDWVDKEMLCDLWKKRVSANEQY